MAEEDKRSNLGRGLSALLGDEATNLTEPTRNGTGQSGNIKTVPVDFLHPGRYQPRHHVDDAQIKELSESIAEKGILQPILVRRHPDEANVFEIIAGERRWRAAQLVQLHEVPVIVHDLSDREALEVALVENLQRQDLSPLEEAEGYSPAYGGVYAHPGGSRQGGGQEPQPRGEYHAASWPARRGQDNVGRPQPVRRTRAGPAQRKKRGDFGAPGGAPRPERPPRPKNWCRTRASARRGEPKYKARTPTPLALERDLSNLLGLKVEIKFHGTGGTLVFHYASLEQLDDILHRLSHGPPAAGNDTETDADALAAELSIGAIPSDLLAAPLANDDQISPALDGGEEDGSEGPLEGLDPRAEPHSSPD